MIVVNKMYGDILVIITYNFVDKHARYEVDLYNKFKSISTLIKAKSFAVLEEAAEWVKEEVVKLIKDKY